MISDADRAILHFEDDHPTPYPANESDVRERFGLSIVRYQQKLNHLIQEAEVVAEFPQLANRMLARNDRAEKERRARLFKRGVERY